MKARGKWGVVLLLAVCVVASVVLYHAHSRRPKSVQVHLAQLRSDDIAVRARALEREEMPPLQNGDLPALIAALRDPHAVVRLFAARALGELGADAKPSVSELAKALRDPNRHVRGAVVMTLTKISWKDKAAVEPAVPALAETMQDIDEWFRWDVLHLLKRLGPKSEPAVPALLEGLRTATDKSYWQIVEVLGTVGTNALPVVTEATRSPDARIRIGAACITVGEHPVSLQILSDALGDKDPAVRRLAARALGNLGPRGKPATSALLQNNPYHAKGSRIHTLAALALLKMGEHKPEAIAALDKAVADPDYYVNQFFRDAIVALGDAGPDARVAVPTLRRIAKGRYGDDSRVAAEALKKIQKE